jgi:hypothetical protein
MKISFERLEMHWTCLESGLAGPHGGALSAAVCGCGTSRREKRRPTTSGACCLFMEEFLRVREFWLSVRGDGGAANGKVRGGGGATNRKIRGGGGGFLPEPSKKKAKQSSATQEDFCRVWEMDGPLNYDDDEDEDSEDEAIHSGGEAAARLHRPTWDPQDLDVSGAEACRTTEELDDQWASRYRLLYVRVRDQLKEMNKKRSRLVEKNASLAKLNEAG